MVHLIQDNEANFPRLETKNAEDLIMIRSTVKCKASNKINEENEFEKSRDRNDSLMGIVEPLMGMYGYRAGALLMLLLFSQDS